jgi:hypothetical protein
MVNKVSNKALLEAGLEVMRTTGKSMRKMQTNSRAMKYQLGNGETVRVRTCNDHVLVVLADSSEEDATLNIEGTDHLLIVMPEVPRMGGSVFVYFVPTTVAVNAARQSHSDWLASKPATKGNNRTWNIWFDDGPATCSGFARTWSQYLLPTKVSTLSLGTDDRTVSSTQENRPLGVVIAEARKAIAEAAGVGIGAVKITVALD